MKKLLLFLFIGLSLFFISKSVAFATGEACTGQGFNGTCVANLSDCKTRSLGISTCTGGNFCCGSSGQEITCSNTAATCYDKSKFTNTSNGCPTGWNNVGACTINLWPGTCCTAPDTIAKCSVNGVSGTCSNGSYGCSTYWLTGTGGCTGMFNMCCATSPKPDIACSSGSCVTTGSCPTGTNKDAACVTSGKDGVCCINGGGGGGSGTGTTTWGTPGSGPSLYSISNILGGGAPNNAPTSSYEALIRLFFGILIVASIVLFVVFFIWGGIGWIMSGGDKQKLQSSKQKLTFSIIGLIVVFTAVIIINFLFIFLKTV